MPQLSLQRRTVIWGHSQGGHAALWAGTLAPAYAPDVNVVGVAALAPASDLQALAEEVGHTLEGRVLGAYILSAYSDIYPDVSFDHYVRPARECSSAKPPSDASTYPMPFPPWSPRSRLGNRSTPYLHSRAPWDGGSRRIRRPARSRCHFSSPRAWTTISCSLARNAPTSTGFATPGRALTIGRVGAATTTRSYGRAPA